MSKLKKVTSVLALIVLVAGVAIVLSLDHWWLATMGTAVFLNEDYSSQSHVYRNRKGEFLITINDSGRDETYVYFPTSKSIGVPNGSQFIFLPFVAYNKDLPVPAVTSSQKAKIGFDMDVVEHDEWIEFTSLKGQRIKLYRSNI